MTRATSSAAHHQQGQDTVPAVDLYLGGLRGVQHQRGRVIPAQAAGCVGALRRSRGTRGAGLGRGNYLRQQETFIWVYVFF